MSRAARWWIVFGACNVVVALALIWTTRVVVALERSGLQARAETDYQESLRLAMWRMDSWLSLLLAREAARPPDGVEPGDPASADDYVELRFAIDAAGHATSPQPERLEGFRGYLRPEAIRASMARADALVATKLAPPAATEAPLADIDWVRSQTRKTQNEFDARVACSVPRVDGAGLAGRQAVVWLEAPVPDEAPALAFVRRAGNGEGFVGYLLDWPRIEQRLLLEIRDLFPRASLERVTSAGPPIDPLGRGLANIPATLVTGPPEPVRAVGITGGRAALGVAWLAAIVAAAAVGTTLRKSIDLGERRRRFVSAVTHELRTPLTTFQMYSEMLADGLVSGEDQRKLYLRTLKDESKRLSAMVANVLAHARIEARGGSHRLEAMTLDALLSRLEAPLELRVRSTPMTLEIDRQGPGDTALAVDPEAIGQILGNLVDNAAKYANGTSPATIELGATTEDGRLILTVRDHGPGIPPEQARAVFAPFERGGRDSADPVPGIGLGLALARGLARDMGGELTLESPPDGGARFRLELPASRTRGRSAR